MFDITVKIIIKSSINQLHFLSLLPQIWHESFALHFTFRVYYLSHAWRKGEAAVIHCCPYINFMGNSVYFCKKKKIKCLALCTEWNNSVALKYWDPTTESLCIAVLEESLHCAIFVTGLRGDYDSSNVFDKITFVLFWWPFLSSGWRSADGLSSTVVRVWAWANGIEYVNLYTNLQIETFTISYSKSIAETCILQGCGHSRDMKIGTLWTICNHITEKGLVWDIMYSVTRTKYV